MNKRSILLLLFGLLAVVQLYVPLSMILNQEEVLASGREYKFKLAPVDPIDFLRGKYITLQYKHNSLHVADARAWKSGEVIYVQWYRDAEGFARIRQVSREKPREGTDYLKTRVQYVVPEKKQNRIFIHYPFDRYYLEESKALPAEQAYTASLQDSSQSAYALVHVKDGNAVLKEVLIGKVPIKEKVQAFRQK